MNNIELYKKLYKQYRLLGQAADLATTSPFDIKYFEEKLEALWAQFGYKEK